MVEETADNRLFVRLLEKSAFRLVHPHELLARAKAAAPEGTAIRSVQIVTTGPALVPATDEDSQRLKEAESTLAATFEANSAEPADLWTKVLIPRLPARVCAIGDDNKTVTLRDISYAELWEEIATAFKAPPVKVSWAARNNQYPDTCCALAAFYSSELRHPPSEVTLFCSRLPVYLQHRRKKIWQCGRCHGFHRDESCTYRPTCAICAST